MKVFNWISWEECESYFTEVLPSTLPPGLPQGKSYYMSQLYGFYIHWKECKRLAKDILKQKNEGVTNHDELRHNYDMVLTAFGISDLDDNLNSFLAYYHYSIYI